MWIHPLLEIVPTEAASCLSDEITEMLQTWNFMSSVGTKKPKAQTASDEGPANSQDQNKNVFVYVIKNKWSLNQF